MHISFVIPTRREKENVRPLLARIRSAVKTLDYEVIFVDDSDDDTPEVIRRAKADYPEIRLLHRPPGERAGGLSGAVAAGLDLAEGRWIVVMDGDLQHPPETIPDLLRTARSRELDLVSAGRMTAEDGLHGMAFPRRNISLILSFLCRLVFPGRLSGVRDPLTGFFMVRREAVDRSRLALNGYKILLDILVSHPELKRAEIPFRIRTRTEGQSKAGLVELLRFSALLMQLRWRASKRFLIFLVIGFSGIFVNNGLLYLLTDFLHTHYLASAALATQGSTLWNYLWTEKLVFGAEENKHGRGMRLGGFLLLNNLFLLLRGPLLWLLVEAGGLHYIAANLASIAAMTIVRYVVARDVIWLKKGKMKSVSTYHYKIHHFVRIESDARLPELESFRVDRLEGPADICVIVSRAQDLPQNPDAVVYDEKLGDMGFRIQIERGDPTRAWVSPLIARSPHVLYTNVVEPLLRWKLVEKGVALVHGACIANGGHGLLVTARTDTGKTTTILKTLTSFPYGFLSDDMTILDPEGRLYAFPKPLTISRHTLRVVNTAQLTRRERFTLWFQSSLHSRLGRQVGLFFGQLNLPAATLNALVQMLVPPPKYTIDRLVPGRALVRQSHLAKVLIIERGSKALTPLKGAAIADVLMANSEDAYGFPPYPVISHELQRAGRTNLADVEKSIIARALDGISGAHIAEPDYGWWRWLPKFLDHTRPSRMSPDNAPVIQLEPENEPGIL